MRVVYKQLILIILLLAGCRFSFDKANKFGGSGPRLNEKVKILILESEDTAGKEFIAGWKSNPQVDTVRVISMSEYQSMQNCQGCKVHLEQYCEKLSELGYDYFIKKSVSSAQYKQTFVCDKETSSILEPKQGVTCTAGHLENQHTFAEVRFKTIDARLCQPIGEGHWSTMISGEKTVSYDVAQSELLLHSRLLSAHFSFAKQSTLSNSAKGELSPRSDFELQRGQVLATFRKNKYLGLSLAKQGAQGLSVQPLSCCFEPKEGDIIQERGRYHLVDLSLGLSSAMSEVKGNKKMAAGLHSHLRYSSIVGGMVFGISYDLMGRLGHRLNQGSVELGYQLKPTPGIELLAALNGGVRKVSDIDSSISEYGAILGALLGMKWNPQKFWFIGGELQLTRDFGLSENMHFIAPYTPLARFYIGLELH